MSDPTSSNPLSGQVAGWRQILAWGAWQPFTGGGLAAFAGASVGRTLFFQIVYGISIALVMVWSLRQAWFPAVAEALPRLPAAGAEIRAGRLAWPENEARLLAERPQFSLSVDPTGTGEAGRAGDLQVELRSTGIRLEGLLGHQEIHYPPEWTVALDRTGATAAWYAWNWPLLAMVGIGAFVGVALWGWVFATLLTVPAHLLGWGLRRDLSFGGAWRLALASGWLGWTASAVGLLLYATAWIRLPGLAIALTSQPVIALMGVIWGVLNRARRSRGATVRNPFQPSADPGGSERGGGVGRSRGRGGRSGGANPFR